MVQGPARVGLVGPGDRGEDHWGEQGPGSQGASGDSFGWSFDPQLFLDLLQGDALGFGHDEQHPDQLPDHASGVEGEGPRRRTARRSWGRSTRSAAAMTQCVKLPRAWPRARTRLGKISLMNTQITAPWPKACEAMNTIRLDQHHDVPVGVNSSP